MFIETTKSRYLVKKMFPSATKIVKVFGGYMVFNFYSDFEIWNNSK